MMRFTGRPLGAAAHGGPRTTALQECQFFVDSTDTTTIRWYAVPPDRPIIPYPSFVANEVWYNEVPLVQGMEYGELPGMQGVRSGGPHYRKENPADVFNPVHFCGSREQWSPGGLLIGRPSDHDSGLCCFGGFFGAVDQAQEVIALAAYEIGQAQEVIGFFGAVAAVDQAEEVAAQASGVLPISVDQAEEVQATAGVFAPVDQAEEVQAAFGVAALVDQAEEVLAVPQVAYPAPVDQAEEVLAVPAFFASVDQAEEVASGAAASVDQAEDVFVLPFRFASVDQAEDVQATPMLPASVDQVESVDQLHPASVDQIQDVSAIRITTRCTNVPGTTHAAAYSWKLTIAGFTGADAGLNGVWHLNETGACSWQTSNAQFTMNVNPPNSNVFFSCPSDGQIFFQIPLATWNPLAANTYPYGFGGGAVHPASVLMQPE